jgi:tetratricopeptide (TPR) repeat protein
MVIDLLIKWSYVFYYRGDIKRLVQLLSSHEKMANCLNNRIKLGMFYAWLGFALEIYGRPQESFDYLSRALKIGKKANDQLLLGYSYAWIAWTCMDLGRLDKGVICGKKAQEISQRLESDHHIYIFFKALNAISQISFFTGNKLRAFQSGQSLIECGDKKSNIRSQTLGHICIALGYMIDGDFLSAIESSNNANKLSPDPIYDNYAKLIRAMSYIQTGRLLDAEMILKKVVPDCKRFGLDIVGLPAQVYLAVIQIAGGKMQYGMNMINDSLRDVIKNKKRSVECLIEYIIGKVYLQMIEAREPVSWTLITKNIGFLVKALPFAAKKAEMHLNRAIEIATEIGANFVIAQANLDLSLLHKAKKRTDKAKQCISEAIKIFEQCEADVYQRKANEALVSLK